MSVGIDFGTTNSVLAVASPDGGLRIARHGSSRNTTNFRSILCIMRDGARPGSPIVVKAGPEAIEAYLEHGSDCRLIQSVKSMAANPNFSQTHIYGRKFTIEDLIAEILKSLRASAEAGLAPLGDSAIAGRPVRFAGQFADEALALDRLRTAFAAAGFPTISFMAEPLGAAYKFANQIVEPTICVVADFGGGTSDFSLLRFAPGEDGVSMETLATSGVGIAGDRLDYRIIERAVCPALGLGSYYRSMGKRLPIPTHYYARFQRWSDLSFLRTPETLRELYSLMRMSEDPDGIRQLIYIVEEELGFDLYRSVSAVKSLLSTQDHATLEFRHGPVQISTQISRYEFNKWIEDDLTSISDALMLLFDSDPQQAKIVRRVFMTGGTSFVIAIRELMESVFPAADFFAGDEFGSVGAGLALAGSEF